VPELPEVEVLARHLRCRLRGKVIQKVVVCRNKVLAGISESTFNLNSAVKVAASKGLRE